MIRLVDVSMDGAELGQKAGHARDHDVSVQPQRGPFLFGQFLVVTGPHRRQRFSLLLRGGLGADCVADVAERRGEAPLGACVQRADLRALSRPARGWAKGKRMEVEECSDRLVEVVDLLFELDRVRLTAPSVGARWSHPASTIEQVPHRGAGRAGAGLERLLLGPPLLKPTGVEQREATHQGRVVAMGQEAANESRALSHFGPGELEVDTGGRHAGPRFDRALAEPGMATAGLATAIEIVHPRGLGDEMVGPSLTHTEGGDVSPQQSGAVGVTPTWSGPASGLGPRRSLDDRLSRRRGCGPLPGTVSRMVAPPIASIIETNQTGGIHDQRVQPEAEPLVGLSQVPAQGHVAGVGPKPLARDVDGAVVATVPPFDEGRVLVAHAGRMGTRSLVCPPGLAAHRVPPGGEPEPHLAGGLLHARRPTRVDQLDGAGRHPLDREGQPDPIGTLRRCLGDRDAEPLVDQAGLDQGDRQSGQQVRRLRVGGCTLQIGGAGIDAGVARDHAVRLHVAHLQALHDQRGDARRSPFDGRFGVATLAEHDLGQA